MSTVSADTLSTSGFTECGTGAQDVTVSQFQINFDRTTKEIMFAVAGTSKVSQNITGMLPPSVGLTIAQINVTAYGNQVYTNTFNPCRYTLLEYIDV